MLGSDSSLPTEPGEKFCVFSMKSRSSMCASSLVSSPGGGTEDLVGELKSLLEWSLRMPMGMTPLSGEGLSSSSNS